jgi:peptidyl-tRNA hydrolase, PTH1 family
MKIIIGLGNPGLKYAATRHNVGFRVIDSLRKKNKAVNVIKTGFCRGWEAVVENRPAVFIKPKTFINESGLAVKKIFDRFGGSLEDYIVIHDDLDIDVGKIKIVSKKGAGGHNGIISIINELGSRDFVRIRVGIGRETGEKTYIDYVLSPFAPREKKLVEEAVKLAASACEEIVISSTAKAMTLYNA